MFFDFLARTAPITEVQGLNQMVCMNWEGVTTYTRIVICDTIYTCPNPYQDSNLWRVIVREVPDDHPTPRQIMEGETRADYKVSYTADTHEL